MPSTLLTNRSRLPSRSQAALTLGAAALLMAGLPVSAIDARTRAVPVAVSIVDRDSGALLDVYTKDGSSIVADKKLLADAGCPQGFEVAMNCPNDRYVNGIAICQALAWGYAKNVSLVQLPNNAMNFGWIMVAGN